MEWKLTFQYAIIYIAYARFILFSRSAVMNFLKKKFIYILIALMTSLCISAAVMAFNVSMTLLTAKRVTGTERPKEVSGELQQPDVFNAKKLSERALYFNGVKLSAANAFITEKKEVLLPIDELLGKIGSEYTYYAADGLLETSVNEKKLLIRLGKAAYNYNGRDERVPIAPEAAREHFLVPRALLEKLGGFRVVSTAEGNSVYVNYFPGFSDIDKNGTEVARLIRGRASLTDITGKKVFWSKPNRIAAADRFEFSYDGSRCILKSGEDIYLVDPSGAGKTEVLKAEPGMTLSDDGRYLYWTDRSNGLSYTYDVVLKTVKVIGNYLSTIKNSKEYGYMPDVGEILKEYIEISSFRRVVLTNRNHDADYTFIERNGRVVIEGNASYSPDRTRLVFMRGDEGFAANVDGTGIISLGKGEMPVWINNSRIFTKSGNEMYLFSRQGRSRTKVDEEWRRVGQSDEGDALFTRGNSLYIETDGEERLIGELPERCEYVRAHSSKGPFVIALGGMLDSVLYYDEDSWMKVGNGRMLVNSILEGDTYTDYRKSIDISPDSGNTAVFQWVEGMPVLNIVKKGGKSVEKINLDYARSRGSYNIAVNVKWISGKELLVSSSTQGWLLKVDEDISIYSWTEPKDSIIQGVITKDHLK